MSWPVCCGISSVCFSLQENQHAPTLRERQSHQRRKRAPETEVSDYVSSSASLPFIVRGMVICRALSILAVFTAAFTPLAAGQGLQAKRAGTSHRGTKSVRVQASNAKSSALLRALSLHDRIAQMIVVRGYGDFPPSADAEYRRFQRWIREDRVGGFIVAGRIRNGNVISAQPFEMVAFINHVQRAARTPLLIASDFERGASARVAGTARFPYLMAFGAARDLGATRELGEVTAHEARALGVNWVFAPD